MNLLSQEVIRRWGYCTEVQKQNQTYFYLFLILFKNLERVAGIEPACLAWKARALPLCYTRKRGFFVYLAMLSDD